MPDATVYGGDPRQVWDCQWPGCRGIAVHKGHRGSTMPYMFVCERHLLELRNLPDVAMFQISRDRQPVRMRNVARSHLPWLLEPGERGGDEPSRTW